MITFSGMVAFVIVLAGIFLFCFVSYETGKEHGIAAYKLKMNRRRRVAWFELGGVAVESLEELARIGQTSKEEVIRRSINLYAYAAEEAKKGNVLVPVPQETQP